MKKTYAHIVLGAGGIGSAAAYWLGRRSAGLRSAGRNSAGRNSGPDVLAIEQFRLGHDRGASEDHSRIIRHSYHSSDYTALTRASYTHWRDLEQETGLELLRITGGLDLAPAGRDGEAEIASYARALAEQGHDYEVLDAAALRDRWPQWRIGDDIIGLHQAEAGILDIRRANSAHVSRALALGVTFMEDSPVRKIVPYPDHVEVRTDEAVFEGGTLTVCAGSWTPAALAGLEFGIPLTLTQEQVT